MRAKRLTREQKKLVSANGLNPNAWMLCDETPTALRIIDTEGREIRTLLKQVVARKAKRYI